MLGQAVGVLLEFFQIDYPASLQLLLFGVFLPFSVLLLISLSFFVLSGPLLPHVNMFVSIIPAILFVLLISHSLLLLLLSRASLFSWMRGRFRGLVVSLK